MGIRRNFSQHFNYETAIGFDKIVSALMFADAAVTVGASIGRNKNLTVETDRSAVGGKIIEIENSPYLTVKREIILFILVKIGLKNMWKIQEIRMHVMEML